MGQGLLTILAQFAAEVSGLPAHVFRPKVDSTFALGAARPPARARHASRAAAVQVRRKLKQDLDQGATLDDLVGRVYAARQ